MQEQTFNPGDHVVIRQNASSHQGRHATVLKILPEGTMAECRLSGEEPGPGAVYPAFPLTWLELESERPLEDRLIERLRLWLLRTAPLVRDDFYVASLKITLYQPQGEDDGTLYLDARLEEELTTDELGGRVPGVMFR